jgi:hypothetical protein
VPPFEYVEYVDCPGIVADHYVGSVPARVTATSRGRSVYPAGMARPTAKALAKLPPVPPTRANIRGMKVILYGEVEGMTRAQVSAALTALGAVVLSKASPNADCALVGAEPKYSKALEREFLWKKDRVKSYGPKTLLTLLGPVAVAAKQAAKKTAAKKTATSTAAKTTVVKRVAAKKVAAKKTAARAKKTAAKKTAAKTAAARKTATRAETTAARKTAKKTAAKKTAAKKTAAGKATKKTAKRR